MNLFFFYKIAIRLGVLLLKVYHNMAYTFLRFLLFIKGKWCSVACRKWWGVECAVLQNYCTIPAGT